MICTVEPLRPVMWLPERVGALGMMPGYIGPQAVMGLKVVSVFPGNHGTEYDSHMGAVMLFETGHGRPLAIIDANAPSHVFWGLTRGDIKWRPRDRPTK